MKKKSYCAVDIGGSKILLVLIDEQGQILFKEKKDTPKPATSGVIVEIVTALFRKAWQEVKAAAFEKPSGLGACVAGFIDHKTGLVYQAPNLEWSSPVNLGALLTRELSIPVLIENDANAAVMGEVYFGAAQNHQNVIYITLSTGIGGGLFLDGRLYRGSNGFAGEIGHIKPYGKGRRCKCGGTDCLEAWASGSAIAANAAALWDDEEIESGPLSTAWVFEQAAKGNTLAQSIVDHAVKKIGMGLSNLVNMLNPSCLVFGGGVAANRSEFLDRVIMELKKEAIKPAVEITNLEVAAAKLEPESGIWGMYHLLTGQTGVISDG